MAIRTFDRFLSFDYGQGHFEAHDKGSYFVDEKTQQVHDLGDVRLLSSTVDTVRQLYRLTPECRFLAELHELYDRALTESQYLEINGEEYAVGSGGSSGYKYRLQNNELGVIIFIKNRRQKPDVRGSHLKIELSPKFLIANNAADAQDFMDAIATWVSIDKYACGGCAIHLALDVQGWVPESNFLNNLVTRARRMTSYDGIEKAEYCISEAAVTYGKQETITVGSVKSVQLCVYDKMKEALKGDKIHFYESLWQGESTDSFDMGPAYNPDEGVTRLELRFHHTVLKQFERGSDCDLSNYRNAWEHLGAMWRYGMNSIRLHQTDELVDPFWQLFSEDADFSWTHQHKSYKRAYKKPGIGNEKNIALAFGNWLSLMARKNISTKQAWKYLKNSGMFEDIQAYYSLRDYSLLDIFNKVEDGMRERRLVGRVA